MSTSKEFYEAMRYRVEAGQFKMEDIIHDLDTAWGKGLITADQYHELKSRAFETCDPNYEGNRVATPYDEHQDIEIIGNTMSNLELFEAIMEIQEALLGVEGVAKFSSIMTRTAIGDSYVSMILIGKRTFESVPLVKKQEVAEKLIERGREDLITDPTYLPKLPEQEEEPEIEQPNLDMGYQVTLPYMEGENQ